MWRWFGKRARSRRPENKRKNRAVLKVEQLEYRLVPSAPASFTAVGDGGGGYLGAPVISPFNANEFYMATDMGAAYHTTDAGQNWTTLDPFQGQISGTYSHPVQFTNNASILYVNNGAPTKSTDGGVTWTALASPIKGNVAQLFGDLNNANNLLVTENNAVYFSTNGGSSFTEIAGPSGSGAPLTLTLPSTNQHLYVAGLYSTSTNDTLYVATNGGLLVGTPTSGSYSWGFYSYGSGGSGLPSGHSIWSLAGATSGSTTKLYAILWSDAAVSPTAYSFQGNGTYDGTYVLTVGQGSWTALASVPQETGASPDTPTFIASDPSNLNVIYQGGTNKNSDPLVWISTNAGQSWTQTIQYANNGNIQTGTFGASNDYPWGYGSPVTGLSVSPTNVNDLLITTWPAAFRSTDGGAHWTSVLQQNPQADGASARGVAYVSSLNPDSNWFVNWANSSTLLAGLSDQMSQMSTSGGASWSVPYFPGNWNQLPPNTLYAAQYDSFNSIWYAAGGSHHNLFMQYSTGDISGGSGGVYYSTDQGKTWNYLHSFGATTTSLALDPSDPTHNTMYATVVDTDNGLGGVWVTRDLQDGTNAQWFHLNQPTVAWGPAAGLSADHHPYTIHVLNNGEIIATYSREDSAMFQGGVFTATVSWTSGTPVATWKDVTWNDGSGTPDAMRTYPMDLTVDPTDPTQQTWYVGSFIYGGSENGSASDFGEAKGLWKTTNGGQTWSLVWGNQGVWPHVGWYGVYGGYVNPNTGELYFTVNSNGLWYSPNPNAASPTIQQLTAFPFGQDTRVGFNPYNASQVWVSTFGDGLWYGTSVPPPPTGLTAAPGNGQVALSWTAFSGASSYNDYRGSSSGAETLLASGISGTSFTDTGLTNGDHYYYEIAAVNSAGTSGRSAEAVATPQAPGGTVWVEDATPLGAVLTSDGGDAWTWVGSNPSPFSGSLDQQSNTASGEHEHEFYNATQTMTVNTGDTLYAYVYLNPTNPPKEVMLQWDVNGSWEHRAYWGANDIADGTNGTASRQYMGVLPATGTWVRLAVPASAVGLSGATVNGMAFTLYGGQADWDKAGTVSAPAAPTGLAARAGNSQVTLTWTAAAGATSYRVYQSTSSGKEQLLASGITGTSFTNTGLTDGKTYYYEVTAVNGNGESALSKQVSATPKAVSLNLSGAFNRTGIVTDGTTFATGGLDGNGLALSANLLGSSVAWNGQTFQLGSANTSNVVSAVGQTITLPAVNSSTLSFLAVGVNGNQPNQTFTVRYTDGTTQTFTQSISNWYTPQSYPGESTAVTMSYGDMSNGTKDNLTFYFYGYSFALNKAKAIASITLPNDPNVEILAMNFS